MSKDFFELNSYINRYLERIIHFGEDFDFMLDENSEKYPYEIETFEEGDSVTPKTILESQQFWEYMDEDLKAIKIDYSKKEGEAEVIFVKFTDASQNIIYKKKWKFGIINIEKIQGLYDSLKVDNNDDEVISKTLLFEVDKSILHINDKKILISKTKNTDAHYLLRTLFTDKNKIWPYDDIYEELHDSIDSKDNEFNKIDKKTRMKFYSAARHINEKVARDMPIKDFLEYTMMEVNINKKYLNPQ